MGVEDELIENKNQDDGSGPDKETDESGWVRGGGGRVLYSVTV